MEDYRITKRDLSEDSTHSHSKKEHESSDLNSKRPKKQDFEKLRTARTELLEKHFGYTDENNPFGDQELTQPFVWEKKENFRSEEKNRRDGSPVKAVQSKVEELKEVKLRREKHETEKSRLMESRMEVNRKQGEETYEEWEARGVEFNLKQIVAKPLMRFKQGRPKLVDKLVLTVDPDFKEEIEEEFEVQTMFKNCDQEEVNESEEILKAYIQLGKAPEFTEYFKNLLVLVKEPSENNYEMSGVSKMVSDKIDEILSKKSIEELKVFESQINKKLESKGIVDTNFWETALSKIPYFKACQYVKGVLNKSSGSVKTEKVEDRSKSDEKENKVEGEDRSHKKDNYGNKEKNKKNKEDYEKFVEYTMLDEDEEVFEEVVEVDNNKDLERPRYYNRVKKGVEWTKYNLAHYDQERQPPKMVQGYKFNIFYPELKGKVPKWKLQKDGNTNETALIRFIGGHPYRDIAFRVVNKEWNTDPQKGFKNFFDNGVLHLYFDFKKIKYRR